MYARSIASVPPRLRFIFCWRGANAHTGTASTLSKSGTFTPARRSNSKSLPTAAAIVTLGNDLVAGHRPQAVVPAHAWQAAQSSGDWTFVGCTVAPGFEFAKFEMAPAGWTPQ